METNLQSLRYKQALELVADLFKAHYRDISGLPYITHLVGVSHIIGQVTDDEDVQVAALLHDVLEDIPSEIYSESDMRDMFGDKITGIVNTVSHDEPAYGKDEARRRYLGQIRDGSIEACLVSAADLLHNAQDIVYLYKRKQAEVAAHFGGERTVRRQWFWSERYKILAIKLGGGHPVIKDLKPIMQRLEQIHQEIL